MDKSEGEKGIVLFSGWVRLRVGQGEGEGRKRAERPEDQKRGF